MTSLKLSEIAVEIRSGFACGEEDANGVAQFRMNNVLRDGNIDWTKLRRVPRSRFREELQLLPGDILFNATNSRELVGKTALFRGFREPVTFSNHFIRLRLDNTRVEPGYAARWLQSNFSQGVFAKMCRSWVNQASITSEQLRALSLPLPSLAEQRQIAAIFDQADDLRRKRRLSLEKLNVVPQAIFQEMFGDATANSSDFEETTLGDVCAVKGGKRLPKGAGYADAPTAFRYIRVVDFAKGTIDERKLLYLTPEIQRTIARYTVQTGDLVMSIAGSIGLVAVVPESLSGANLTENAAKLEPYDRQHISSTFLTWLLRSPFCQSQIASSTGQVTIGKLALFRIEKIRLLLPTLEQQKIFERRVVAVQDQLALMARALEMMDELVASLQHHAFAGTLTSSAAVASLAILQRATSHPGGPLAV